MKITLLLHPLAIRGGGGIRYIDRWIPGRGSEHYKKVNNYIKMKIQEVPQSQFNIKYAGDVCLKKVNDCYQINSNCIFSEFNIIKIGHIYLLYGIQLPGRDSNLSLIQVLTIYEYQGLNLLVIDVQTQIKHNIIIGHPSCEAECNGEIIDIEYFNKNFEKWMNQR